MFGCLLVCLCMLCIPPTWSIVKQYVLKHYGFCIFEKAKKGVYMEKQTVLALASDLGEKWQQNLLRSKMSVCAVFWTCQILCIHNFFSCIRIWIFTSLKKKKIAFSGYVRVCFVCVVVYVYFMLCSSIRFNAVPCYRQTEKKRDHISYLHTWLVLFPNDVPLMLLLPFYSWHDKIPSQCFSEHIHLDLTLLRLSLFLPHSILSQQKLSSMHVHVWMQIPFVFHCLSNNLFIYFDWCWWFRVEFVVSCQRTVAMTTTKRCQRTRESVSLSNRIPMDKEANELEKIEEKE